MVFRRADTRDHGKDKCSSFASATLALSYEVAGRVREQYWQSLFLDLGGSVEPHTIDTLQEIRMTGEEEDWGVRGEGRGNSSQTQFLKRLDGVKRGIGIFSLHLH